MYYSLISSMSKTPPIVWDTDALAFVTITNITNYTQQVAVNNLVKDLKTANLWTKMKALYPFVGGTAFTHKFNLKDPRDDNSAFRLSFANGWIHSDTGVKPNGSDAFADTFLTPSTSLSLNSSHISGYLRTNLAGDGPILSAENATTYANGLYLWPKQFSFGYSVRVNDSSSASGGTNLDEIRGFHIATRTASNVKKYRYNTTQKFNLTTASTALNTSTMYLAKSRNNNNWFANQMAFASIGDGMSDAECDSYYSIIQAFQVALGGGRAV